MSTDKPIEDAVIVSFKERILGKRITTKKEFMGEELVIQKMTINEISVIQDKAGEMESLAKVNAGELKAEDIKPSDAKAEMTKGLDTTKLVIRLGCPSFADFTNEEFDNLPLEELLAFSAEIMEFSGISQTPKK